MAKIAALRDHHCKLAMSDTVKATLLSATLHARILEAVNTYFPSPVPQYLLRLKTGTHTSSRQRFQSYIFQRTSRTERGLVFAPPTPLLTT